MQIKNALDATIKLGGTNYVFWGGREGYYTLLNTQMQREKDHLAKMLAAARDYARAKGFKGTFLIEPKPMEPTKHQYDVDTETVIGFLRANGLGKKFEEGKATLEELYDYAKKSGEPTVASGKQELYETLLNLYAK